MIGTTRWFDSAKGYGFLTTKEGTDYFVHYKDIIMDTFPKLINDEIVDFEVGTCKDGRTKAINVKPILTKKMVRAALKKGNLFLKPTSDRKAYIAVDENNVIQTYEQGMSLLEMASFAGIDVSEIKEN